MRRRLRSLLPTPSREAWTPAVMVNEYQKVERDNRESHLLVKARRQVPDAEHGACFARSAVGTWGHDNF